MTPGNVPSYTKFLPGVSEAAGLSLVSFRQVAHPLHAARGASASTAPTRCSTRTATSRRERLELDGAPLPQPKPEDHYYTTVAIADYGVRFLKEHAREHARDPFLLYLAPHSPHFPLQALPEDIAHYKDRFAEGWDTARERKHARMRRMGLVNCALAPLEPNMWTRWNTPDEELFAKDRARRGDARRAVEHPHGRAEGFSADQDGDPRRHDHAHGPGDRQGAGAGGGDGRRARHGGRVPLR